MDGTLIDSQRDITISINYIRALHYNLDPLSSAFIVEAINRDQRNLAKLFYETESYREQDRKVFEEHYYDQCIENPVLYNGIEKLLRRLKAENIRLSVATNAPTIFAKRMLFHLGVGDYFDHIVGADRVLVPKPDKEMLHYILDQYGFIHSKDQAWMLGDNSKDMKAAKNADITGVFVTWGFSPVGIGTLVINEPCELLENL